MHGYDDHGFSTKLHFLNVPVEAKNDDEQYIIKEFNYERSKSPKGDYIFLLIYNILIIYSVLIIYNILVIFNILSKNSTMKDPNPLKVTIYFHWL